MGLCGTTELLVVNYLEKADSGEQPRVPFYVMKREDLYTPIPAKSLLMPETVQFKALEMRH